MSFLRKKKKSPNQLVVNKNEFYRLKPVISPFVEQKKRTEDSLLLKLNISELKKRSKLKRHMPIPDYKRIQLDKLGMDIFLLCDGKNRVKDIIQIFQEKYKLTQTETELSVQKFLMSLTERHLIGFLVPEEIVGDKKLSGGAIEKVILEF